MSTYNGQKYIEKQLNSVRKQTLLPDEVVIRDDCSTDNTVSIIDAYIKKYCLSNWRLSLNETNLGYKESFYKAIEEAKGDYIFLCDQDDLWKPEKINNMVNILQSHSEIWSLNCGVELINGEDRKIDIECEKGWRNANFLFAPQLLSEVTYYDLPYILRHNITPGCAMVIDKRTREGFLNTYDRELPHDWHMNIVAAANGGCAYLDQDLILYRQHTSNAIGANIGAARGIRTKTRDVRIEDYKSRISACKIICKYYGVKEPDLSLLNNMISFYESPNPIKLVRLWCQNGYKELAKNKVKLWETIVAFRLDGIIKKIVGE